MLKKSNKEILCTLGPSSLNKHVIDRLTDLGFHVFPNLIGKMKTYIISELSIDIGTIKSFQKEQTLNL